MISYCICCFRAPYGKLLIEDLVAKTTVPYEILLWINTPDRSIVEKANALAAAGAPIKIVGDTPENIGMAAFKTLFKNAKYDMIAQLDDDVLRVSPNIPQKCAHIFLHRNDVKYIVADVWQDEYTNGNRPGMDQYKLYAPDHQLYDGPIDSWYGVYHRSIMPVLMRAPYEKYFYLGSFVRGWLPRDKKIGVLCTQFKVLHACGPIYAKAFGLLEGEINKYHAVGIPAMADAYAKAKHPDLEVVLAQFEKAKKHIDGFGL
jgi:hypothetical protein